VDEVLPLNQVAAAIMRLVGSAGAQPVGRIA
jgi:hypothetical protein